MLVVIHLLTLFHKILSLIFFIQEWLELKKCRLKNKLKCSCFVYLDIIIQLFK